MPCLAVLFPLSMPDMFPVYTFGSLTILALGISITNLDTSIKEEALHHTLALI